MQHINITDDREPKNRREIVFNDMMRIPSSTKMRHLIQMLLSGTYTWTCSMSLSSPLSLSYKGIILKVNKKLRNKPVLEF
jgi:hypothetical protein